MRPELVEKVGRADSCSSFSDRHNALIRFAEALTMLSEPFSRSDTNTLRAVLPDPNEVTEAAAVVAGFNFANRVADALAIPFEVPGFLRHRPRARRLAMTVMSAAVRHRMRMTNRPAREVDPDRVLADLQQQFTAAGMGPLPPYFYALRVRPHLVVGHARLSIATLTLPSISRTTRLRVGHLISTLTGDQQSGDEFARLMVGSGIPVAPTERIAMEGSSDPGLSARENACLCFARAVTRHAQQTTDEQVDVLRRHGLEDGAILDLVLASAAINAGNRMSLALG